uniref:G_PROTEIN_RECEP_F1_2 domain-containing protein n=1 Tax=Heterorhabditis bacteriophora TaxID=37862 RepID=A0A1I7XVI6_HETBA
MKCFKVQEGFILREFTNSTCLYMRDKPFSQFLSLLLDLIRQAFTIFLYIAVSREIFNHRTKGVALLDLSMDRCVKFCIVLEHKLHALIYSESLIPYTIKILLSALFVIVGCVGLVGNVLTVLVIYKFKRVVPDFCGYNRELEVARGSCDYVTSQNVPFRYPFELTMVVTFVLPLIFIVYCYFRILATLNEMATATTVHIPIGSSNSDTSQVTSPSILYVHTKNYAPPKSQQAQKMVIKMLAKCNQSTNKCLETRVNYSYLRLPVFFVCYLPYHLERLIVQYTKQQCDSSMFCLLLYPITGLLQYISATLNPVFYNLMSTRFRTAFNQLIKQIIPKREREYSTIVRI